VTEVHAGLEKLAHGDRGFVEALSIHVQVLLGTVNGHMTSDACVVWKAARSSMQAVNIQQAFTKNRLLDRGRSLA
jgi:hypothetical protein